MKLTRHLFIAAALAGTLVLAGCDSGDDTEQAAQNGASSQTEQAAQNETSSQTEQQASRTLQGKLEFSATETPLPEEAEVTVSLKDTATADASTVITETTVIPGDREPVEFTLDYDASAVSANRAHIVQATLYDGDGNLHWSTKEGHTVELGPDAEQEPITLVLEPATSGPSGDESLQEAQQDMLEPESDTDEAPSEAGSANVEESDEEIDEKATDMQEPTTSEADTTTAQ